MPKNPPVPSPLPFDYARCEGVHLDVDDHESVDHDAHDVAPDVHLLCRDCMRRTPGHPTYQVYMSPPMDRSDPDIDICRERITMRSYQYRYAGAKS